MKKTVIVILLFGLILLSIFFLLKDKLRLDGNSSDQVVTITPVENEARSDIEIESPRRNEFVSSPIEIRGKAIGSWFFEASFTAELIDAKGQVIAEAILTAEGDWMTEELVPFNGSMEFVIDSNSHSGMGMLLFKSANPSGLPENQKTFSIPVRY